MTRRAQLPGRLIWLASVTCLALASCRSESSAPSEVPPAGYRRIEARIVGRPHRPFLRSRRADESVVAAFDNDASAREPDAGAMVSGAALSSLVERQLDGGHSESAIALLSSLPAGATERDSPKWTGLSAAYLAAWSARPDSGRYLAFALDAAVRATEEHPTSPAGWFNVALVLQHLGMHSESRRAWERWAGLEREPSWRAEGEEWQRRLSRDDAADPWEMMRAHVLDESRTIDRASIADAVRRSPQSAREVLQDALLPQWAAAYLEGRARPAQTLLQHASDVAIALRSVADDSLDELAVRRLVVGDDQLRRKAAAGFLSYGEGRRHYEANSWEAAGRSFEDAEALLTAAKSPMAAWARVQTALVLYQRRRLKAADAVLRPVLTEAGDHGYVTARMRAHWLQGLVQMQHGAIEHALRSYDQAIALAERAGERENVAAIAGTAADTLRVTGDHETGWRYLKTALNHLPDVRSVRRRYTLLLNVSLYASDEDLPAAALFCQNSSLAAAEERGVPSTIAEGLIRRASLFGLRGDHDRAVEDLTAARQLISAITSPTSREYQSGWWETVSGEVNLAVNPTQALVHTRDAIHYFRASEPAEVPRLHLLEGRALLATGAPRQAERAFLRGTDVFEARWKQLAQQQHQISYLDESWKLFQYLIGLYADRRDHHRAFESAERVRARALMGGQRGGAAATNGPRTDMPSVAAVQEVLPERAALAYYVLLESRLLIWLIARDGVFVSDTPVDTAAVTREVSNYRRLLEAGVKSERTRDLSHALHAKLIAPIRKHLDGIGTITFVGDGAIDAVPFATLIDPASGRFLIEQYAVSMAPSAAAFLSSSRRLASPRTGAAARALVVGVPRPPPGTGLPVLPDARREVSEVAAAYESATTLMDDQATPTRMLAEVAAHEVLHFAGHARANLRFPSASVLVMSPDGAHQNGGLSASEIAQWRIPNVRLVALSACRTAYGPVYRGEGVVSLARPFFAGGAASVVGALWDVPDKTARRLLARFHRIYASSGDPVSALRSAQLELLHEGSGVARDASSWGAFTVIGASRTVRR